MLDFSKVGKVPPNCSGLAGERFCLGRPDAAVALMSAVILNPALTYDGHGLAHPAWMPAQRILSGGWLATWQKGGVGTPDRAPLCACKQLQVAQDDE